MKNSISRFIIISLVLMCLMGALIYKLHEVTIVEGAQYAEAAANTSTSSIDIKGTRGRILDRNGVVLAYSKNSYNVEFLRDADNRTDYDSATYTDSLIKAIKIIEDGGGKTIDTGPSVVAVNIICFCVFAALGRARALKMTARRANIR